MGRLRQFQVNSRSSAFFFRYSIMCSNLSNPVMPAGCSRHELRPSVASFLAVSASSATSGKVLDEDRLSSSVGTPLSRWPGLAIAREIQVWRRCISANGILQAVCNSETQEGDHLESCCLMMSSACFFSAGSMACQNVGRYKYSSIAPSLLKESPA